MSRENGDSHGLWPADDQVVPLSSLSATVAPSPNGDRAASALDEERPGQVNRTASEFTTERMIRPSPDVPSGGWRRVVFSLSHGRVAMGPSPDELRRRELVARVKTPVAGCRKIAFISRKGGVGKTTTCLLAGHTFATHRGDRVIALDGNPDAGTLGHRVRRETTANLTSLLADADRIERYADIRGYTSQAASRLEVVASDDDPRITQAIGESEFHRVISLARAALQPRLPRHRNRRPRIGHAGHPRLGRSDRRRQRSEPRRSSRRKRHARLARRERLPAPRRGVRRRTQRGRPNARRRRRRPDRGALREALPLLRPRPVGSASRGRGRGIARRAAARNPAGLPRARRCDRRPASPTRSKGGHSHDHRLDAPRRERNRRHARPERPAR